jgi:hypothetical protein
VYLVWVSSNQAATVSSDPAEDNDKRRASADLSLLGGTVNKGEHIEEWRGSAHLCRHLYKRTRIHTSHILWHRTSPQMVSSNLLAL